MGLHTLLRATLVLTLLFGGGCPAARRPTAPPDAPGRLTVHFLDVGQGDAALLVSPTGKTVLVDGGPPEAREALLAQLAPLLHGPLDLVLLTHPHLDHLGGLSEVLRRFGARAFLDPGFEHPSRAYAELLEEVNREHIPVSNAEVDPAHPEAPVTIGLGGGATLTLLWPRRPVEPFLQGTRSDVNANSVVGLLRYGRTAFLLAGDAEPDTEAALLARSAPLRATVLKVGHHGSHHSSTAPWLAAIRPEVAVISVGAHNEFGHPGAQTLERLGAVGATVYRTDRDGEVTAVSDGTEVTVRTARAPAQVRSFPGEVPEAHVAAPQARASGKTPAREAPYVGSRRGHVFHRAGCEGARHIRPENRVFFTSREAALASGRTPAQDCHP